MTDHHIHAEIEKRFAPLLDEVRQRLLKQLQPVQLEVINESAMHIGHAGAAGGAAHLRVRLQSPIFHGCSAVARHRLVYDALADLMPHKIHALALDLSIPPEQGQPASTP